MESSWGAILFEEKIGIFGSEANGIVIFGSFVSKTLGNLSKLTIFFDLTAGYFGLLVQMDRDPEFSTGVLFSQQIFRSQSFISNTWIFFLTIVRSKADNFSQLPTACFGLYVVLAMSSRSKCYRCGKMGHFAKECTLENSGGASFGDKSCYGCGETGHISRNCPKKKDECYNCGQTGHMQRDCPDGDDSRGSGRSEVTCYKCGKEGHFQRDCSENGTGNSPGRCYRCNKSGHFARDCQDDSPSDTLCYRCNKRGHFARECPSSDQTCYNCGKTGHLKRDCSENDVTCYRCNETGHFARDCPDNDD